MAIFKGEMKMVCRFCWLYCFFAVCFSAYAQQFEITGSVTDASTGEPVPFANIAIKDVYKGTASNALGEFSLKVDSLPLMLEISHLSYESMELEAVDQKPLMIKLTPGKLLMDELVISEKGNDEYAYKLVENAFDVINKNKGGDQYGKAFYRQISKNGDDYSELYEIFYDTRFNLNGVDDWAIQEGRYALKLSTADSFIYNKNFTLMVRLLSIIQPKTDDLIMPVIREVRDQYDLRVNRMMSVNGRKVAEVQFDKIEDVTLPAMEGSLYIDVDTFEVLRLKGTIVNDNLKFISLKGKLGSWKNYQVSCEIAFKPMKDGRLALDYMRLGQNFDYYYNGVFANKLETISFLSYYEYYTPPKRKKLGGRLLRFNKRDSELLDNIGYDQQFWDENIIVKRTPLEAKVIESFEADRAFGSIYLNNTNQIILEDYKLDADPFIIRVKQRLQDFDQMRKGEKLYLHHDKPFYASGESMDFKAYLVNVATNIPERGEATLHVDLLAPNGSVAMSGTYPMLEGRGQGQLAIADTVQSGVYALRAHTDKMGNGFYYNEALNIYNPMEEDGLMEIAKLDSINSLSYYPEGGSLVESMPGQIGISARDQFGNGLNVRGRILDENGRSMATINNEFNGLGSIFISPKSNVGYRTLIMSDEVGRVAFPEIKKAGYAIMVNNLKPNTIDLVIRGTPNLEGRKFYILVLSSGILFERRVGIITRGMFRAEIPKSNLPGGMAQILLADDRGAIRCKRLVFINQPEEASVKYYLAKKDFRQREKIDMVLEFDDENGKPLANANFSISVLDKDNMARATSGRNIKSYFNFGYISDVHLSSPGALFEDYERETLKKMDLVMLSQQTVFPDIGSFDSLEIEKESNKAVQGIGVDSVRAQRFAVAQVDIPAKGGKYLEIVQKVGIDQMLPEGQQQDIPDSRTAIYWNPNITTNKNGRAKISFYNSDRARNLQICIEGITTDGTPIFDIHDIGRNARRK